MKKTNLKKMIVITILLILVSMILPQISKAAVLQANTTTNSTPTKLHGNNWPIAIREMETTGQAMGLTETVDSTSYLGTTESNGIDVHMMKSTEYGAMAILSASGFGNPSNESTINTTTGNKTGVYMQTETYEWVSGAGKTAWSMSGTSIAHRYFNTYTNSTDTNAANSYAKPGDALNLKWHTPSTTTWVVQPIYGFFRGGSYGVFGYNTYYTYNAYNKADPYASRAVVVSGEGF